MQYTLNLQVDCYNTITAHLSEESCSGTFQIFLTRMQFFSLLYYNLAQQIIKALTLILLVFFINKP